MRNEPLWLIEALREAIEVRETANERGHRGLFLRPITKDLFLLKFCVSVGGDRTRQSCFRQRPSRTASVDASCAAGEKNLAIRKAR